MTIRRAVFDRHVLALGEADLAQTLPERIHQRQRLRRALVKESPRETPRSGDTMKRHQLVPPTGECITNDRAAGTTTAPAA
jgi:hypothetical protein